MKLSGRREEVDADEEEDVRGRVERHAILSHCSARHCQFQQEPWATAHKKDAERVLHAVLLNYVHN